MLTEVFSPADLDRAADVWDEYQRTHDLTGLTGETAGVDPLTGEVFVGGRTAGELIDRLRAEGRWRPLVFWRVGLPYYGRVHRPRLGSRVGQ